MQSGDHLHIPDIKTHNSPNTSFKLIYIYKAAHTELPALCKS